MLYNSDVLKVKVGKFEVELDSVDVLLDLVEASDKREALGKGASADMGLNGHTQSRQKSPVPGERPPNPKPEGGPDTRIGATIENLSREVPAPFTLDFLKALEGGPLRATDYFASVGITGTRPVNLATARLEWDIENFLEMPHRSVCQYLSRKHEGIKVKRWFPMPRLGEAIRKLDAIEARHAKGERLADQLHQQEQFALDERRSSTSWE